MTNEILWIRRLLIVLATAGAGAIAGVLARVGREPGPPVVEMGVGLLTGLVVAPLALWIVVRRPLARALPALLLLPMGVAAWLGPRANVGLTITGVLATYAMAALAIAFFLPVIERPTPDAHCATCGGRLPAGATRCPHCAVSLTTS